MWCPPLAEAAAPQPSLPPTGDLPACPPGAMDATVMTEGRWVPVDGRLRWVRGGEAPCVFAPLGGDDIARCIKDGVKSLRIFGDSHCRVLVHYYVSPPSTQQWKRLSGVL
jgi:hypothetical protein